MRWPVVLSVAGIVGLAGTVMSGAASEPEAEKAARAMRRADRPVISPLPQPVISPLPYPIISPLSQPVISPLPQPVISPLPQPVISPLPYPVISPLPLFGDEIQFAPPASAPVAK